MGHLPKRLIAAVSPGEALLCSMSSGLARSQLRRSDGWSWWHDFRVLKLQSSTKTSPIARRHQ
jgi:hypothetical protein